MMTNSKESFDLTLAHKQPSKIVVDLGSRPTSGIHCLAVEKIVTMLETLKKLNG